MLTPSFVSQYWQCLKNCYSWLVSCWEVPPQNELHKDPEGDCRCLSSMLVAVSSDSWAVDVPCLWGKGSAHGASSSDDPSKTSRAKAELWWIVIVMNCDQLWWIVMNCDELWRLLCWKDLKNSHSTGVGRFCLLLLPAWSTMPGSMPFADFSSQSIAI